jgi:class 3 adenylate cyclase
VRGIEAARALKRALPDVGTRSGLEADGVVMRFGLHWGSKLFVGQVTTSARAEVNALGDEVNETARIEAYPTCGLVLASKDLLERLEDDDATALNLGPARLSDTALADLPGATEKARRDAPSIAVSEH